MGPLSRNDSLASTAIDSLLGELERVRAFQQAPPPGLDGLRLGPELGRGAMAVVYRATDELGREVALKLAATPWRSRAIERERRALALAGPSPDLARLVGGGHHGGREYLLLELIEGESLAAPGRLGRLPFDAVARALAPVARALARLHAGGILHRDVKPANVVKRRDGRGTLIDLGLARLPGESEEPGRSAGTPSYMAPEHLRGGDRVGPAADVFSLGVTLWELLAGHLPQVASTVHDLLLLRATQSVPPLPRSISARVPDALIGLVHDCLAPDPADRPEAAWLARALEPYAAAPAGGPDARRAA